MNVGGYACVHIKVKYQFSVVPGSNPPCLLRQGFYSLRVC